MTDSFLNRKMIIYVAKFLITFCFFYYGTLAIIGLSAPGGYYNSFIAEHLNFINWLRASLFAAAKFCLSLLRYKVHFEDPYIIKLQSGAAVKMVYTCIGYGIMSFWAAFIIANTTNWKMKLKWIFGGWVIIWCLNVVRLCLLLIAINNKWVMPLGLDHHTWFNIVAYFFLFMLIYFYDKATKK